MIVNQFVSALLKKKKGERIEFKQNVPQRDALGRVLCSFANAGGGTVVIGVTDHGRVMGIDDARSVAHALLRDAATMLSPSLSVSVNVVELKGKGILLVDVPEGLDKPYTFGRQVYVRHGDRSELAEVSELRELLSSAPRFGVRWERRLAGGIAETDLDQKEVDRLLASAEDKFGYSFPRGVGRTVQLEVLNLASHGQLHNGAVVLLGQHPEQPFPQTRVRAICFGDEAERHVVDNMVFEGCAFKLVEEVFRFVHSNLQVSSEITGARLDRGDETDVPMVALREALLNAVQHRDYEAYDGSVIVKITPAGISIWNPGSLPEGMTVGELTLVHYSRPRNPDIAHAFFLRGLVERIGSGTSRILTAMRDAGLPDAKWQVVSGGLEIMLFRSRTGREANERQRAALDSLVEGDTISPAEYRERFASDVSDRQARSDLNELVRRGLLARRGAGKSTRYERTGKMY